VIIDHTTVHVTGARRFLDSSAFGLPARWLERDVRTVVVRRTRLGDHR